MEKLSIEDLLNKRFIHSEHDVDEVQSSHGCV